MAMDEGFIKTLVYLLDGHILEMHFASPCIKKLSKVRTTLDKLFKDGTWHNPN